MKWGSPVWVGSGNVLYLICFRDHVNLGLFQGARLAARFPQIEGTGKGLRHVKILSEASASSPAVVRIIRAAIELDRRDSA
jgi:hypothetical protein